MVNNRIACFLTCGYTEAGAMQFFLRKVNDKFEYKQYLPNKTIKKKGSPKSIDKEISGLTGEKLLKKVYEILDKHKDEINCCRAVLIEDDLDGKFHNWTNEKIDLYKKNIVNRVRDILENQEMKVFLLFASPEAEAWFVADWDNGFKALYESNSINDLEYSERQFFTHQLKQYLDREILKEYADDIEMYGYFGDEYLKLSDQIIRVILEDIKKYLLENSDNHTYAEKISASRNLYYSKKLHGDRMMRTIVPDILGARCRHFFRPTYLELCGFTMGESQGQ